MAHPDLLWFIGAMLLLAVLIGLKPPDCPDPSCRRVHGDHVRAEEAERKANLEREAHRTHSRDWPAPNCVYCRDIGGFGE